MFEASLRELLEAAAEAGVRRAIESLSLAGASCSLIPIKEAPVAYRAILAAEQKGELHVYRRGKSSLIDLRELEAWIRRTPCQDRGSVKPDEVGELIALRAHGRAGGRRR